jgi:hypothetical protein
MRIFVRVVSVDGGVVNPSPPGPGHRFFFTENLTLEEYDGVTQNHQLAGSHSGYVSTLRIAQAGDIYPQGSYLFQYEGTYRFNTVPNTPLMRGQVTARGILHGTLNNQGQLAPLDGLIRLAITGGTEAYVTARGQITEGTPGTQTANDRVLDIQL